MKPKGPFQAAVLATFDRRRWVRWATAPSLFATLLLSLGLSRQSDPYLLYAFFFTGVTLSAVIFWVLQRDTQVIAYEGWRVSAWPRQILGMAALLILAWGLVLALRGFAWNRASDFGTVLLFVVVVAIAEEWARWVWLHTLPYSPIVANLLWVLLHPQVGRVLAGQAPDLGFALFAFVFGLGMTGLMWLRESGPRSWRPFFGPMAAVAVHAGYNLIVLVWLVSVSGVVFHAF